MRARIYRRDFVKTTLGAAGLAAGWSSTASAEPTGRYRLRFAVASDGHFGQPETDYKGFHEQMIFWLNEEARGKGLDFVVFNGDLIHDDVNFLPQAKEHYQGLEVPFYVTQGNHDHATPSVWKKTWGYEVNSEVEKGEYAFLLGTTSNQAGEYLCADESWLKSCLKRHRSKQWVFVFLHISQAGFTRHGITCSGVTRLLDKTENVAAVFHGHDHDLDHVIFSNGRAYLFDGHLGGSWGTNYRGYRIVEIDREGGVRSYQCDPQAFYVNNLQLYR